VHDHTATGNTGAEAECPDPTNPAHNHATDCAVTEDPANPGSDPANPGLSGKAIALNLQIVKDPVFNGDLDNDIVLRQFGNAEERGSNFYLALTAESLRDAAIDTLDFSIGLGSDFAKVFELNTDKVFFSNDMAVQRRVELLSTDNGPSLRFEGAGLENLGAGQSVAGPTVLAYIQLQLRDDINQLIKDQRSYDEYGLRNHENFRQELTFDVSANVDNVVFSDRLSLRDVGGTDVLFNPNLDVTVRAADVDMHTHSRFKLGTKRSITKPGEGSFTNLVRHGDTLIQTTKWRNNSEFSLSDLHITDISNNVADVLSTFANGSSNLNQLGWSDAVHNGEVAYITSSFTIKGAAGSVLDTTQVGFEIDADGDYSWNTTQMSQFAVKNLVTFQGDINYDGSVGFKDLAFLNAGAAAQSTPHDVDANYDGAIDMLDLAVIDADWGKSLHNGANSFIGSNAISMAELSKQGAHAWDSSAFKLQNAIEAGTLDNIASGEHPPFADIFSSNPVSILSSVQGTESLNAILEQQQQHALTSV
jgi:hypothetical protein